MDEHLLSVSSIRRRARRAAARGRNAVARRVPPGWRWLAGLVLVVCGVFGFLPVLGFWMIPLGAAVAALDIKPVLERRRRGRLGGD